MANTRKVNVKVSNDNDKDVACLCFLCSIEIQKIQSASIVDPHEISFILTHILEVPQLEDYLERVKGQPISYCSQCSIKVTRIRDVLEELERLEKVLLDEKYEIELHFRGNSHVGQGQGQGSVADIRNDIVTDLRSSTIFSMMEKLRTKQIGRRSSPRTSIRIMRDVSLPRHDESPPGKSENHDRDPNLIFPSATTTHDTFLPVPAVKIVTIGTDMVSHTDHQIHNTRLRSKSWSQKEQQQQEDITTIQKISRLSQRNGDRTQSLEFSQSSYEFLPHNFVKVEEGESSDQLNLELEHPNSADLDNDDIDLEFHPLLVTDCIIGEGEEIGGQCQDDTNTEDMDNTVRIKVEQEGYDGLPIMMDGYDHSQNQNGFHVNGEFIDLTEEDDDDEPQNYQQGYAYDGSTLNSELNPTAIMCWKCGAYFENFDLLNEHDVLLHPSIPESLSQVRPSKRTIFRMRQTDMVNKRINLASLKASRPRAENSAASSASTSASTSSRSSRITCNECGKTFVSKICLRNHVRHMHLGIFNYRCPVCQLGCRTRAELRLHLDSHSDIRKYNCHVCQKSFKQKKNLVAHEKLHTTGPGFTCNLCGEQFWYVREFRRHALTHKAVAGKRQGQGPGEGQGLVPGGYPNPIPRFHDPRLKYLYNRVP